MRSHILIAVLALALSAAGCEDYPPGESPRELARREALHHDAVRRIKQANAAIADGDYEQANIHAQWAIVADKEYAPAYDLLAWIALNLGQTPLALTAALEAVRLAPDSASYRRTLGVMLEESGRLTNAVDAYGEAVAMNPADPASWLDLARVAHRTGDWTLADSAFDRVAELMPAHFDTATADRQRRADARAALGR
ncbi:MAG TPA: tetratricopeptide repeat protein [Longimicrobiales bacterium]